MKTRGSRRVINGIIQYRNESRGENRWNCVGAEQVIRMVEAFDNENIVMAKEMGDSRTDIVALEFLADIALHVVGTTRNFEPLNESEISAYEGLMEDLRNLRTEYVSTGWGTDMFFKMHNVREIIYTNAIYREDYDCKYRMGMIFPRHEDMCSIIHHILENWEKLSKSEKFERLFYEYSLNWKKSGLMSDQSGMSEGMKRANDFNALIDECIEKS